jgi:glyoxylase-like metal-dependent hydrolase (beta-lactamase superfamily II)
LQVVEEVVPGLYKISLPLPTRSLGNVFVYLYRDGRDSLLVDAGWNDKDSYERLLAAFSQIGFRIADLKRLVLTHLHPDHIGLAGRLKQEAPSLSIFMHERDAQDMVYSSQAYEIFLNRMESFLRMHGTPKDDLEQMVKAIRPLETRFVGTPKPDVLLKGGEKFLVGKWSIEVLGTPGHTRGNICLFDSPSNILFSGDHILPTITPNVSLSPIYQGDPLGDYLRSLSYMKKIDPTRILPSHEYVFQHLGRRIEEIEKHHHARLDEVMRVLGESIEEKSGYEVARELTWAVGSYDSLSGWQKRAALTETLAHLEYLKRSGNAFEFHEGVAEKETVKFAKNVPRVSQNSSSDHFQDRVSGGNA